MTSYVDGDLSEGTQSGTSCISTVCLCLSTSKHLLVKLPYLHVSYMWVNGREKWHITAVTFQPNPVIRIHCNEYFPIAEPIFGHLQIIVPCSTAYIMQHAMITDRNTGYVNILTESEHSSREG